MIQWYGALGGYGMEKLKYPQLQVDQSLQVQVCKEFNLAPGFMVLAPGAEYGPAKRWPAEHFAQVAKAYLAASATRHVVVLGGLNDIAFSEQILALLPLPMHFHVNVLAGRTNLPQAMALMACASTLITNDSGLMHVGAALNIPLHAVFGSSSPDHTPPLSRGAKIHYLALACSPCFQRVCPLGHTDCLNKLKPEMVIDQLDSSVVFAD